MKNFEKNIAAVMAANVWNLKVTFWAGLVMSAVGCGGILYVVLTSPDSVTPFEAKLVLGLLGLLIIICETGIGFCYRRARKSYQEFVELNKKALEQE